MQCCWIGTICIIVIFPKVNIVREPKQPEWELVIESYVRKAYFVPGIILGAEDATLSVLASWRLCSPGLLVYTQLQPSLQWGEADPAYTLPKCAVGRCPGYLATHIQTRGSPRYAYPIFSRVLVGLTK